MYHFICNDCTKVFIRKIPICHFCNSSNTKYDGLAQCDICMNSGNPSQPGKPWNCQTCGCCYWHQYFPNIPIASKEEKSKKNPFYIGKHNW